MEWMDPHVCACSFRSLCWMSGTALTLCCAAILVFG